MKPGRILLSLVAMVAGWLAPLGGLAAYQLAADGRITDLDSMAFYTGVFALLGWAMLVVPCLRWLGNYALFATLRLAWLGWSLLGMGAFCLLVVPLTDPVMLLLLWYPAIVGAVAGTVFALLLGTSRPSAVGNAA